MSKKKTISKPQELIGYRLSSHEKVCAERMKTLFKTMDEVRKDVKDLRADINKGKGAINFIVIVGGFVALLLGYFKFNG